MRKVETGIPMISFLSPSLSYLFLLYEYWLHYWDYFLYYIELMTVFFSVLMFEFYLNYLIPFKQLTQLSFRLFYNYDMFFILTNFYS